jgi:hypothetical protein
LRNSIDHCVGNVGLPQIGLVEHEAIYS